MEFFKSLLAGAVAGASGGGGSAAPLYMHIISIIEGAFAQQYYTFILSNNSSPFTAATLFDYVKNLGYTTSPSASPGARVFPCFGVEASAGRIAIGLWAYQEKNALWFSWCNTGTQIVENGSVSRVTDKVVQIS